MTTNDFYQHFDRSRPLIQRLARKLVKDFDTARYLYQETAHRAIQQRQNLQKDTFEDWLKVTMKSVYANLQNRKSVYN